jgi:hypothetical protein
MEIDTGYNESVRVLEDVCEDKSVRIISIPSFSNKSIAYFKDSKLLLLFKNCTYIQINEFIDLLIRGKTMSRKHNNFPHAIS